MDKKITEKSCNHCGNFTLNEKGLCSRCDSLKIITVREFENAMGIDPKRKYWIQNCISKYIGDPCSEDGQRRIKEIYG